MLPSTFITDLHMKTIPEIQTLSKTFFGFWSVLGKLMEQITESVCNELLAIDRSVKCIGLIIYFLEGSYIRKIK